MAAAALAVSGCSDSGGPATVYGAGTARLGESQAVLGWNVSVANLRFADDRVLIDVDAALADDARAAGAAAEPDDLRFGLYGALAHPIEATGTGSCAQVAGSDVTPLYAPEPTRVTGTVCLGPIKDQAQVRGVYLYSPRDRIPRTVAAYPAPFPVGVNPTNPNDTGLVVSTTSVEAWRGDGTPLSTAALGDPTAFTGNGYMLLGLQADAEAARYRDDSQRRGGPMMLVAAPTMPPPGLSPACSAYGSSVLVLPDTSRDTVHLEASLCTQGEINEAVLYATVSVVGTHAAVWRR
nr:hypothetical protein [Mycolicibacterium palauense]